MEQVEQAFYFINNDLKSTADARVFSQLDGKNIYEVIRVQQSIPLFLEDHLDRFKKSAAATGLNLTDFDKVSNQNIKMILNQSAGLLIFFTRSIYPPQDYYINGMHTTLLKLERPDPNIKILRKEYQQVVLDEREKQHAYEVLLVDQQDHVTEGSRSNLFIVHNKKIYTSPANNVLLGIIRKKTLLLCNILGIDVVEETIPVKKLNEIDGAFITGTGNNILPIRSIGDRVLNSTKDPVIQALMIEYDQLVETYIKEHKLTR